MSLINLIFVLCLYTNNINYIYFVTYPSDGLIFDGLITEYNIQYNTYPINASKEYQEQWLYENHYYIKNK